MLENTHRLPLGVRVFVSGCFLGGKYEKEKRKRGECKRKRKKMGKMIEWEVKG
jgi:hypothetical protein